MAPWGTGGGYFNFSDRPNGVDNDPSRRRLHPPPRGQGEVGPRQPNRRQPRTGTHRLSQIAIVVRFTHYGFCRADEARKVRAAGIAEHARRPAQPDPRDLRRADRRGHREGAGESRRPARFRSRAGGGEAGRRARRPAPGRPGRTRADRRAGQGKDAGAPIAATDHDDARPGPDRGPGPSRPGVAVAEWMALDPRRAGQALVDLLLLGDALPHGGRQGQAAALPTPGLGAG